MINRIRNAFFAAGSLAVCASSAPAGEPFDYILDDGVANIRVGPPTSFEKFDNTDMIWGNVFEVEACFGRVVEVTINVGTLTNGPRDVEFHVYDDPNNDFDPTDVGPPVASLTVQMTSGSLGAFETFTLAPGDVDGVFFVAAVLRAADPGDDTPARLDPDTPGDRSWLMYSPLFNADDLPGTVKFTTRMDNPNFVPIFGAWAIRAAALPALEGDVTGDGTVDLMDLNAVLAAFGTSDPAGDADGSGAVDLADLNIVLANFGESC